MLEFLNPLLSTLSMVADQRIPTNSALILRKVESLLLRHCSKKCAKCGAARHYHERDVMLLLCCPAFHHLYAAAFRRAVS